MADARQKGRVLHRDPALGKVAVEDSGASLIDGAATGIQKLMEWVHVVIPVCPDLTQAGFEIDDRLHVHGCSSNPSCPMVQPAASTGARSRLSGCKTRVRVVDLDINLAALKALQPCNAAVEPVHRDMAHAGACLLSGSGARHFIVFPDRSVE